MLERPFVTWLKTYRRKNLEAKELVKYTFEKSDEITIWIIGLSLASIAGLVATLKDISNYLSSGEVKTVFLFLSISVISGVLYRMCYLFFYIYLDTAYKLIDDYISGEEHMNTDSELSGEESFEELLRLNYQYQDLTHLQKLYDEAPDNIKEKFYSDMVAFYKSNADWAKRDTKIATDLYIDALKDNLWLTDKDFDQNNRRKLIIYKYLCTGLYIIFLAAFLLAFIYFLCVVKVPN